MKKLMLTSLALVLGMQATVLVAADVPNKRVINLPVTEQTYKPAWNLDTGYMYGINSKSNFAYARLGYDYNDFVPFVEYGYSKSDNQYAAGGLGYNLIYRNLTVQPNIKAGYNWDQGRFVSPGVGVQYRMTQNVSLTGRYDYVMKEHNKIDNRIGAGLTLKF